MKLRGVLLCSFSLRLDFAMALITKPFSAAAGILLMLLSGTAPAAKLAGHPWMRSRRKQLLFPKDIRGQDNRHLFEVRAQAGVRHGHHAFPDRTFCEGVVKIR
jgi:hypothetical protein